MFELLCFFFFIIGCCDLALALIPPVGMASKEFHRELEGDGEYRDSRSEARMNYEQALLQAEKIMEDLNHYRVVQINTLAELERFYDHADYARSLAHEVRYNARTWELRSKAETVLMKWMIYRDTLDARLEELSRSESRVKERA